MEIVSNIQEKKSNERAITFNRFSNIWVNQIIKAMWPWDKNSQRDQYNRTYVSMSIAKCLCIYLCALVCLSLYPSMSPDAKYEIHLHLELQEGI